MRAATEDREMVGALGVNQSLLFTAVFALGSLLGRVGRRAAGRARAGKSWRWTSPPSATPSSWSWLAAWARLPAPMWPRCSSPRSRRCASASGSFTSAAFSLNFSKLTLVAEFLVMAVVLIVRPHGLLGRPQIAVRGTAEPDAPIRPASKAMRDVCLRRAPRADRCCRCWRAHRRTRWCSASTC